MAAFSGRSGSRRVRFGTTRTRASKGAGRVPGRPMGGVAGSNCANVLRRFRTLRQHPRDASHPGRLLAVCSKVGLVPEEVTESATAYPVHHAGQLLLLGLRCSRCCRGGRRFSFAVSFVGSRCFFSSHVSSLKAEVARHSRSPLASAGALAGAAASVVAEKGSNP